MYTCSKCGLGVLVTGLSTPIRACSCIVKIEIKPTTFFEKVLSFFGKKYYTTKQAAIVCDVSSNIYSKSTCTL